MKNNMFSGCKDVFSFTLKQAMSRKYAIVTLVLALIFFGASFAVNAIMAFSQSEDNEVSQIKKVYVIDESGLTQTNWNETNILAKKQFADTTFEQKDYDIEELALELKDEDNESVISKITKEKNHYQINVYIPYGSEVSKSDGENLAKEMANIFHECLIQESGADMEKISFITSDMNIQFSTVGDDAKSSTQKLIMTLVPIVFMLLLYVMVIIYGQNMGQIVSIEKLSKLMETLLVTTKPYGLIFGKILAMAWTAIVQIAVWIAGALVGFWAGDYFAKNAIYADYENKILSILSEIVSNDGGKAFSAEAAILSTVAVCLAFLFYCMLAGAIASFASKANELSTVMAYYSMLLMFGFLGSYVIPMVVGQAWIKVVLRLIPISSAFLLPGEILVGGISVTEAILYECVMLVWIVLTAIFAGKVYKDQVFYSGKNFMEMIPWLKKKITEDDNEQEWEYLHDEDGKILSRSQKIGYFVLATATILIFFILNILASLVVGSIMTRIGLKDIDISLWEVKDYVTYYDSIESKLNSVTLFVTHMTVILSFGLWMYFIRKGINRNNIFHIKSLVNKKPIILTGVCAISGLCLCLLANGVVAIESVAFPSLVEKYIESTQSAGLGVSPFSIFAAVCLAPIGEELLCRGVCLHFGKKALSNFWYANILQALVFGILHMNWVQGVYVFILGIFLGILVERYNSLLPGMIVHFIVNFSSSTWLGKLLDKIDLQASLPIGICLVAIPGIILTMVYFCTRKSVIKSE